MYPMLYHTHHLLHMEDIPFWIHFAGETSGPILELGCGTGRVLIRLAEQGHLVTGIDNDPGMLSFLRDQLYPSLSNLVQLHEFDFTEPFNLQTQFPLIILPCNTLSTFYSHYRKAVFENVHQHLTPGGKFIFSIPNPTLLEVLEPEGDFELEDTFLHPKTGKLIEVFSSWCKEVGPEGVPFLTFHWRYQVSRTESEIEILEATTSHVMDPTQSYLSDLMAAGLIVQDQFGDFDLSPYHTESTYLIVIARHAG